MDNELYTQRLECLNNELIQVETNGSQFNKLLNDNFLTITQVEQGNTSELERTEVKLHLLEETLNRRSDKYKLVVKEQQNLSRTLEMIDKNRKDCEKRTLDNGENLKKKLDDLNKTSNINYRDTIEML